MRVERPAARTTAATADGRADDDGSETGGLSGLTLMFHAYRVFLTVESCYIICIQFMGGITPVIRKTSRTSPDMGFEGAMPEISLSINGAQVTGTVEGRTLLVEFIRETMKLTGTHTGCDTSQCGACTVHLDGKAVKSCTMLAARQAQYNLGFLAACWRPVLIS